MAWYEKMNPFTNTVKKDIGGDDGRMWTQYNSTVTGGSSLQSYINSYGNVGWVFACVQRISSALADTEWILKKKGDDTIINAHPILDLLNFVNPFHTGMEMMEQTQTYIDLVGEAFWLVLKDMAGRPSEIWVINPEKMKVVPSKKDYIAGYVYSNAEQSIPLDTDDVIHIKMPNPSNPYRGLSAVSSIMSDVDAEKFSSQYNKAFFQNSAEPSGIIQFDGVLNQQQYDRLKFQWQAQHQGVSNAHKIAILEGGASWSTTGISQRDMQFKELRLMNRDVILGAFGMPLSILGISETVNRANAESSEYTFARWVVRPRLQRIRSKLNEQFVPLFGDDSLRIDYKDPVPQNVERDLAVANQAFQAGYITRNEARVRLGLEAVSNGDIFFTPLASMGEQLQRNTELKLLKTAPVIDSTLKETRWKNFVDSQAPLQNESSDTVYKFLQQQEKSISDFIETRVKDNNRWEAEIGQVEIEWREKTAEMIYPIIEKAFNIGGKTAEDNINDRVNALQQRGYTVKQDPALQYSYLFNATSPSALATMRNRSSVVASMMSKSTFVKVRSNVIAGVIAGQGATNIATTLVASKILSSKKKADMVARTETLGAINAGNVESAQQSKVVKEKEWITTLDGSERESHADMDGVRVGLTELFDVEGDKMTAPTQGADPEQNINCRCTILEVLDVDALSDVSLSRAYSSNEPVDGSNTSDSIDNTTNIPQASQSTQETAKYTYPILEARCPRCKKLLGKKLTGAIAIFCNRCKVEIKFDARENKAYILTE